ncbi:DNA replication/repair protein RecF [Mangrovibacterium marinum]|uniref:DNA replication and repair protein RecF n=1 Tax=Mangrovibacterium marinum TaxID=1639118 RepID=A0A2T5BYA0_9BACT|nr:DNA replication/repair protein RecF [Mangrovibacterium marinum]PTN06801.1 DNA replication and repair protein RecF [Mangrovibacterium marinum]
MYLESLSLLNFKNIEEADLQFSADLNCFIGNNGAGKTNLMDAIYYLSFCKSFLNSIDGMNIRHEQEYFVIQGRYQRDEQEELIHCGLKRGQKKTFKRNKKEYRRLAEHIGLLPLIIVTPSDSDLIMGGSEERRKFLDAIISQYDQAYLDALIRYNRALQQRNKLLKQFAAERFFSADSLEVWSDQLVLYGEKIHAKRQEYIAQLQPIFQHYYALISSGKEVIGLEHQSQLYQGNLEEQLKQNLDRDRMIQYTTVGIHKDDILFKLGDYPIKKIGSQGQKKTYLVAMKLAQFDFIKKMSGLTPILLLDDIFDKLDKNRVEQIVKLVADEHFGQIFITDTNREHLDQIIRELPADAKIFKVDDGIVNDVTDEKK